MKDTILYIVLELREFIIFTLAALVALTVLAVSAMGRKKQGMKDFGWQMMLFSLNAKDLVMIALGISQVCLICSIALFPTAIGTVQAAAVVLLCVIRGILSFSPAGFLGEVVYGGLMSAALIVENLLRDYMRETGIEAYIGIIWILLCIFIIQYSLYYFVRSFERILLKHGKAKDRRRQKEKE